MGRGWLTHSHNMTEANTPEALITKYFIEDGAEDVESFKALEKCFGQEHRGPTVHSHFMRHFCRRIAMPPKHSEPAQTPGYTTSNHVGTAQDMNGGNDNTPKPDGKIG